jgi:3-oxocholest-4-en-26-oate---CoA ligase
VVQPREGKEPTVQDLDGFVRRRIAGYKVPREVHLVESIRRHPSGKPDYPWAQRLVGQAATATTAPSPA